MRQPALEVGGQFDADHLGAGGVEQRRYDHRERGAVVAYTEEVRAYGGGEPRDGLPGVVVRQRRFSRRSQRRRHIAEPFSARRRTGPSQ